MKISSKIGFIISLFLVVGIIFVFSSCLIPKPYPPEPDIKFESYTLRDSVIGTISVKYVILKISFTDGDGDIGLDDSDALSPYTNCKDTTCNNLYINRYGVKGGVLQSPVPFNYRIPVITPTGQNKTLMGEIDIDVLNTPPSPYDTIVFEIYLYDRALNQSNVITSPEILNK